MTVLAGSADAVATTLSELEASAAAMGLKIAYGRDKSLLVPCAKRDASFDARRFPDSLEIQWDGNFDLLGSPIGSAAHCRAHTTARVEKARTLLSSLSNLPDPAVALLLLRHCASFGKLVYSARVVPHMYHTAPLRVMDDAVRECLESFACLSLSAEDWDLASLSTKMSGLGLRQSSKHCAGAFLASSIASNALCVKLDPDHILDFDSRLSEVSLAVADYDATVSADDKFHRNGRESCSQRHLSKCVDAKVYADLKASADEKRQGHLALTGVPGAGTWLHTQPSPDTGNHMDPLLYRASLQRWLRLPVFLEDGVCPLCDGVLDKYGDHCLVCPNGGCRTKRHNRLRNEVYHQAVAAGLNPQLETPGLLQPRPFHGPQPENGVPVSDPEARRPADVYIPRWRQGLPMALDFAVTSGLRDVASIISDPTTPTSTYEAFKRNHMDTERTCIAEGLGFTPMVVEAVGGAWGAAANSIFTELAKAKSIVTGEPVDLLLGQLRQHLGVVLHRENARAILKRSRVLASGGSEALDAAVALQSEAPPAG